MVDTVRRALDKNPEKYFISTFDVVGDFINQSRGELGQVRKILSGKILKKEQGEEKNSRSIPERR